jgi:Protein of unknown function (DUF3024)
LRSDFTHDAVPEEQVLSEIQVQEVDEILTKLGDSTVPIMVRDKVVLQFRIDRHDVVLFEKRPSLREDGEWTECSFAKFRWNARRGTWSLLWSDRNGCWHNYLDCDPSPRLEDLVREVKRDPTGIFWG